MATLKASNQGLESIKQARKAKGWTVYDPRWLEEASRVLGVSWQEYEVLAEGISEGTWKRFLAGTPITTNAFKAYCQVLGLNWEVVVDRVGYQDWENAPTITEFYGRTCELQNLKEWVIKDQCRLVILLGMGGIGKTTLAVKLAEQVQQNFEFVIWRSLHNAPALDPLLSDLIQCLADQRAEPLPASLDRNLLQLLSYLRTYRCLLVLDNAESILRSGDRKGRYRLGYEGYGQLLQAVGETAHQSCLLLTTREKPTGLATLEGDRLPIRSWQLMGLPTSVSREFFATGSAPGADLEAAWKTLTTHYAGNPLALKIAASTIQTTFEGNASCFLAAFAQQPCILDDIQALLSQQFQRLSALEQSIMVWLAIKREPVVWADVQADFVTSVPAHDLLGSLVALRHRSLIENRGSEFTQQPVVMEFVTAWFVDQIVAEIAVQKAEWFRSHALLQAQAQDYVRETQARLILQPIAEELLATLGSSDKIAAALRQILTTLQGHAPELTGYAGGNALNLLRQLQVEVGGWDFSQLTIWQAYLQGMNLHQVNFSHSHFSRSVFTETLGNILAAAFSPDGQFLATCDTDCKVRIWEVSTGKLLGICQGHQNWVRTVAFSPDGRILASAGADQTLRLWDVATGNGLHTCIGHCYDIYSVAFSPNGQIVASGSGDCSIKLWEVQTGQCCQTLAGHTHGVRSVVFNSQGEMLISGSSDHTIMLWNVQMGCCLKTLHGHTDWVRSLTLSPDGQILASGSSDRTIRLWSLETGKCRKIYQGHSGGVYAVAFAPQPATQDSSSLILASGGGDCALKLWDTQTDECLKTLHGHRNQIFSLAFNSDGRTLACVSLDQTTRLWDWRSGQCLRTLHGHTDWAFPVVFASHRFLGPLVASGSSNLAIKLWHLETGRCVGHLSGHTDQIFALGMNLTDGILASGSTDQTVRLWHLETGQPDKSLTGHRDWVRTVAFSANGRLLASGSADQTIKIWDWQSGQCLRTLIGHSDQVYAVVFSPDSQRLISGSTDQTLRLWNVETGECLQTLTGHSRGVYAIALSRNGKILASASADQTVKLWDVQTGQCIRTLYGHTNWVLAVALSSDGGTIASGSSDQTVRLWDSTTGQCRKALKGHCHSVSAVAFGANDKLLASGSQDQTVRLWDSATGQCQRTLQAERLYEGMQLRATQGLSKAQLSMLKSLGATAT